jgi:ABC-type Zn2+ transport system substrate-binding protein/surface adhesin
MVESHCKRSCEDDLRYERERRERAEQELRDREKEADDRHEHERREAKKNRHPSNQLQRGQIANFEEGMRLYRQQMEYENALTERLADGQPITDQDRKLMESLSASGRKADEAAEIYRRHVAAAEAAAVAELRAKGDDDFTAFAEALESGDYSTLAI